MHTYQRKSAIVAFVFLLFVLTNCEGQNKQTQTENNTKPTVSIEEKQKRGRTRSDTIQFVRTTIQPAVDFRAAARAVTPAVVHINSTWKAKGDQENPQQFDPFKDFFGEDWFRFFEPFRQRGPIEGSASGVILTPDGYIITNNHVIQDADEIEVVLHDQRSYKAKVVGTDAKTDLSLLKIDEDNLSFIEFGNSDAVEVGEWVLAVGNPFNLASTVTAGIVSAKARNINILRDREAIESFIQTDAAVNPGNSGGALVNLEGKLIGINSAIATPTGSYAGYSFAIPVNLVKKISNDLLAYGAVQRGYMGIIIRDMTGNLARDLGIPFTSGVYVDSLTANSAAKEAGIRPKDIIVSIDEIKVATSPELQEIVAKHRPGEKLKINIIRGGEKKEVTVVLKAAEAAQVVANKVGLARLQKLGIEIQDLSAREKEQNRLKGGVKVTQVSNGIIQQLTEIRKGFIITSVNGNVVLSKNDFINALTESQGTIKLGGIYPGSSGVYYYGFNI